MRIISKSLLLSCAVSLLSSNIATADSITKPHTFIDGNTALADEVNANFNTVYDQVNKVGAAITIDDCSTDAIHVDVNGNVGIGTTGPGNALQVGPNKEPTIRLQGGFNQSPKIDFASSTRRWWLWNENQDLFSSNGYLNIIDISDGSGAVRMTFDTNGNVGIGTTSPYTKLEVTGTVTATAFSGNGSGLSGVVTTETDPSVNDLGKATLSCGTGQVTKYNGSAWACADDDSGTGAGDGHSLDSADGSVIDAVHVENSGNVGIGVVNATAKLSIVSDTAHALAIRPPQASSGNANAVIFTTNNQGANIGGSLGLGGVKDSGGTPVPFGYLWGRKETSVSGDEAGYLSFGTRTTGNQNERMRITSIGNIGIGTTSPTSKLEVAGTIHSTSGGIKFPDGTTQTTASAGISGWERVYNSCSSSNSCNASCSAGKKVVGGGCLNAVSGSDAIITGTYPSSVNVWQCSWNASLINSQVWAICVD